MKKVYLAGPISGLTYEDVVGWRDTASALLKDKGWTAINPVIPIIAGRFPPMWTEPAAPQMVETDLARIGEADAVIVGYPHGPMKSDGTMFEAGRAFSCGKPIVVWVYPFYGLGGVHPFLSHAASCVTDDLHEAVNFVATARLPAESFMNPAGLGGVKHDADKLPLGLLPRVALEQVAAILAHGAEKYGRHNWRRGIAAQRNIDAALRHIFAANEGEDLDPASGLPHFAHAICDLMFVVETLHTRPDLDDRYRPSCARPDDEVYSAPATWVEEHIVGFPGTQSS